MKNGLFSLFMYIRITGINNKETDKGIRILFSNLLRLYTLAHHTTGHERKLNNNETKKNQNKWKVSLTFLYHLLHLYRTCRRLSWFLLIHFTSLRFNEIFEWFLDHSLRAKFLLESSKIPWKCVHMRSQESNWLTDHCNLFHTNCVNLGGSLSISLSVEVFPSLMFALSPTSSLNNDFIINIWLMDIVTRKYHLPGLT